MSEKWIKRKGYGRVKKIAEEHWEWLEKWLRIVYVDAFIHGYKHGEEDAKNKN